MTLELMHVPITCIDTPIREPCVPHHESQPPAPAGFWCNYQGKSGDLSIGPVVAHKASIKHEGMVLGLAARLSCPWPSVESAQRMTGFDGTSYSGSFNVSITFWAKYGDKGAVSIPFQGVPNGNVLKVSYHQPPSAPPPAPPYTLETCADYFHLDPTDGIKEIRIDGTDETKMSVYCEFDNTNKVAWTLVSRIASGETYHMCSNAYGSLTSSTQSAAWKLSDADINTLKGKSSLNNPYKFYCSQTRTSGKNTQYFEKACKFDGSAPLQGSSATSSKDSPCHNYHDSYSDTTNNVGYGEQRWSLCRSPPLPWLPSGQQQGACASCPVCARRTVVWQLTCVPLSIVQRTITIVASVATPISAPISRTGAAHTLAHARMHPRLL